MPVCLLKTWKNYFIPVFEKAKSGIPHTGAWPASRRRTEEQKTVWSVLSSKTCHSICNFQTGLLQHGSYKNTFFFLSIPTAYQSGPWMLLWTFWIVWFILSLSKVLSHTFKFHKNHNACMHTVLNLILIYISAIYFFFLLEMQQSQKLTSENLTATCFSWMLQVCQELTKARTDQLWSTVINRSTESCHYLKMLFWRSCTKVPPFMGNLIENS